MRRMLLGLLVAGTAMTLATYAWRGVYARYIADDYCTAAILASRGFWSSQGYWYRAWSGRFAFTFAIGIAEQFGPRAAMILPLLAIAAWTAIAARSARWAAGLAIVYATIDGAPDIFGSLIWQTGMVAYVVPLILTTAWCAAYIRRQPEQISWLDAVIPFVAAGFSELFAICAIAFYTLAALFTRGRAQRPFLVASAASLLALIIEAAAPGNAIRRANFAPLAPPLNVISATLWNSALFLGDEVAHSAIPLAVVFLASAIFAPRPSRRMIGFACALILNSTVAAQFITQATLSAPPPARSLIVPHFFIVLAVAILGASAGARIPRRALAFALVVAIVGGPLVSAYRNVRIVSSERAFAQEWDALDAALRRGPRTPRLVNAPETVGGLFFITSDERHWANRCVADYYRLPSIRSAAAR